MELHFWGHSITPTLPKSGKLPQQPEDGVVGWLWL